MKEVDTYKYKGWLNSDFLWKRSLAVYGHSIVAVLTIMGAYFALAFVFLVLTYFFGI